MLREGRFADRSPITGIIRNFCERVFAAGLILQHERRSYFAMVRH